MRWTFELEVMDDTDSIVACGLVRPQDEDFEAAQPLPPVKMVTQDALVLTKEELYSDLATHGLNYGPRNQNITSIQMGDTGDLP